MPHSALPFCFLTWLVIPYFWSEPIHALPLISNVSVNASGLGESGTSELIPRLSIILDIQHPTNMQLEEKSAPVEQHLLNDILDFLQDNFFLILVITGLLVITFLILCSAVILSHRRKVSAYYPCSYPAKMYVDKADKTGGVRIFSEVPEKAVSSSVEEPTNKAKQLQEDIITATKNLRSPKKSVWSENEKKHKSDEENPSIEADGKMKEHSHIPEEKSPEENVIYEAEEESNCKPSQDKLPLCQLKKSDPNLSLENEHLSASDELDAKEDTNNKEISQLPFISEEKTAF